MLVFDQMAAPVQEIIDSSKHNRYVLYKYYVFNKAKCY
jgi:hypothetical protein